MAIESLISRSAVQAPSAQAASSTSSTQSPDQTSFADSLSQARQTTGQQNNTQSPSSSATPDKQAAASKTNADADSSQSAAKPAGQAASSDGSTSSTSSPAGAAKTPDAGHTGKAAQATQTTAAHAAGATHPTVDGQANPKLGPDHQATSTAKTPTTTPAGQNTPGHASSGTPTQAGVATPAGADDPDAPTKAASPADTHRSAKDAAKAEQADKKTQSSAAAGSAIPSVAVPTAPVVDRGVPHTANADNDNKVSPHDAYSRHRGGVSTTLEQLAHGAARDSEQRAASSAGQTAKGNVSDEAGQTRTATFMQQVIGDRQSAHAGTQSSAGDNTATANLTGAQLTAPALGHLTNTQIAAPVVVVDGTPGSAAWQQAIGQQSLRILRNGQNEAQIQLHPRDLGQINISVSINAQNQAQMHFVTAHADVRDALQAALPQLRETLAGAGLSLGQSTVSDQQRAFDDGRSGRDGRGTRNRAASIGAVEGPSELRLATPLAGRLSGSGRIDIFA